MQMYGEKKKKEPKDRKNILKMKTVSVNRNQPDVQKFMLFMCVSDTAERMEHANTFLNAMQFLNSNFQCHIRNTNETERTI